MQRVAGEIIDQRKNHKLNTMRASTLKWSEVRDLINY